MNQDRIATVVARIEEMVIKHNIKAVYACFSGGDDSAVMAWLSSHHPLFKGVIFANTLTGDKETIDYVRQTCKTQGWELHEVKPTVKDRYPALLASRGVPTPPMHPTVFGDLKGKPMEKKRSELAKKHKCKTSQIMYVTGVRRAESRKRMETVQLETVMMAGKNKDRVRSVWAAPIFDYLRSDLEAVFETGVITRNQHAYKFGASRECGCKATEGRQDPIVEKQHFPVYWERRKLQYELARAAYALQQFELEHGLIDPVDATIPEYGAPTLDKHRQLELFPYRYDDEVEGVPFLCVGCESKLGEDIDAILFAQKTA